MLKPGLKCYIIPPINTLINWPALTPFCYVLFESQFVIICTTMLLSILLFCLHLRNTRERKYSTKGDIFHLIVIWPKTILTVNSTVLINRICNCKWPKSNKCHLTLSKRAKFLYEFKKTFTFTERMKWLSNDKCHECLY